MWGQVSRVDEDGFLGSLWVAEVIPQEFVGVVRDEEGIVRAVAFQVWLFFTIAVPLPVVAVLRPVVKVVLRVVPGSKKRIKAAPGKHRRRQHKSKICTRRRRQV